MLLRAAVCNHHTIIPDSSTKGEPSHPSSTLPQLDNQALYPYAHLPTQARSLLVFIQEKNPRSNRRFCPPCTHHTHLHILETVWVPLPRLPLHPSHLSHTELTQLPCLLTIVYCVLSSSSPKGRKKYSQSNRFLCLPILLFLWALAFFWFPFPFIPLNLFLLCCAFIIFTFALSPCEKTEKESESG
ncbi:hypothetical protein F5H01DRAFT_174952 [Linnemannia elongata]|nr:hypothetical protein F5H01DRAFT_174952 [Linnemannia elongata]